MDLKDFFPSIKFDDFILLVRDWHKSAMVKWHLDKTSEALIKAACFGKDGRLPIGYPSSPVISNTVMYSFDTAVEKLIDNPSQYGEVRYTRYADDLVFSTNKQEATRVLLEALTKLISKTKKPNIILNRSKIHTGSSTSGSAIVTGLRVTGKGHITIHRNQKDHIRLLLSLYKKKKLKPIEYKSILGHLAYVRNVDSAFYSKLQTKYFKEISELKAKK